MVESAKTCVSVLNQEFWARVVNYFMIKFADFSLIQLIDVLTVLNDLGFQGIEINPEFLPE